MKEKYLNAEDIPSLIYHISELFTPSTPVGIAELFAGRINQATQLLSTIAERGRHAVIYGERGVGKTSLSHVIRYLVPAKNRNLIFHRKPCDPSDDFTSIWKKLFCDMEYDIKGAEGISTYKFEDLHPGKLTPHDVVREMKLFKPNDIPVFVIDEFNEVEDPQVSVLMANTIKALSDEASSATIIIVGVADSVTQLFEDHASIDRCCEQVPMPRMSTKELGEIIDQRLSQLSMGIHGDARTKILTLSRGLPMYVHSLGRLSALQAVHERRKNITERDVDNAIEKMVGGAQQSLKAKYTKAVYSNQPGNLFAEVLLACALAKSDDNGLFTPASLRAPLSKILNRDVEIAHYQNHLNGFVSEQRGKILQKLGTERAYRFRFRDPAMQPFVLMRGISDKILSRDLKDILSFPEQPDLFPDASIPVN